MRLAYRRPYSWTAALEFLGRRAVDGVEQIAGAVYRRTIAVDGCSGVVAIENDSHTAALIVTVDGPSALAEIAAARIRRMFDLDADVDTIAAHLARDRALAPHVRARPGLRVFRGWDGFEVAARSIIGQQVTVARARTLNGVLVERCGLELPASNDRALSRIFPTPRHVLHADLSNMGMPGARVAALKAVARAAADDPRLFESAGSLDETIARLRSIPGIGEWTAHYIAMRACGEPDAFPASDVGLLRGAADGAGRRPTPAALSRRAERWRPWRAYAARYLWTIPEQETECAPPPAAP